MKKALLLTIVLLLLPCMSLAQGDNSVAVDDEGAYKAYCEILGKGKTLSTKVTVSLDFGQKRAAWFNQSKQSLVDEDGNIIEFNSMIDALNFMSKLGWNYVESYVVTEDGHNVLHFLLVKNVHSEDEIHEGIMTRAKFKEENPDKRSASPLFR